MSTPEDRAADLVRETYSGEDWRASRAALRTALQGMVIDEIDFDPGEFDTNASILTLRAFAMNGTKPAVEVTLSAKHNGIGDYPRIEMKVEPWLREEVRGGGIRGKVLTEAIEGFMREHGTEPIHYGAILSALEQRGTRISGVDPGATLLTCLSRSEIIESMGNRSGMYRLKEDA